MVFQKEATSASLALGNKGQIVNGFHSYCSVTDCVTSENISVGEFAQSVANNDNEAKSTAGKQATGEFWAATPMKEFELPFKNNVLAVKAVNLK